MDSGADSKIREFRIQVPYRTVTSRGGEAKKHVEGQKSFFTAESVVANPIVILVDLSEISPTHMGSSGHWERPDERLLTARRQIHGELVAEWPSIAERARTQLVKVLHHSLLMFTCVVIRFQWPKP